MGIESECLSRQLNYVVCLADTAEQRCCNVYCLLYGSIRLSELWHTKQHGAANKPVREVSTDEYFTLPAVEDKKFMFAKIPA